jgi:BirA family biotin operon repressor/biotin-[acetyl-CoA-carboxylase] ligase
MIYPDFLSVLKLDVCDSTNTYIKDHYEDFRHRFPLLVTSGRQTGGRGRENRQWFSPHQLGLYSSFGYFLKNRDNLNLLSLTAGIAIAHTLKKIAGESFKIKWPNDVLVQGKKAAGILTETVISDDRIFCISGMGINVNHRQEDFPEELRSQAISLRMVAGREFDIDAVNVTLAHVFFKWLGRLEMGQHRTIIRSVNRLSHFVRGETVHIREGRGEVEGVFEQIGPDGGIVLTDQQGNRITCYSGEIRLSR